MPGRRVRKHIHGHLTSHNPMHRAGAGGIIAGATTAGAVLLASAASAAAGVGLDLLVGVGKVAGVEWEFLNNINGSGLNDGILRMNANSQYASIMQTTLAWLPTIAATASAAGALIAIHSPSAARYVASFFYTEDKPAVDTPSTPCPTHS